MVGEGLQAGVDGFWGLALEDVLGPVELEAGFGEGADLAEGGEDGGDGGVVEDLGCMLVCGMGKRLDEEGLPCRRHPGRGSRSRR